jgi:hypothetical protein
MKGLPVELRGEGLDRFGIDHLAPGREFLADRDILEIASPRYNASFLGNSGRAGRRTDHTGRNQTPEATAADNITP